MPTQQSTTLTSMSSLKGLTLTHELVEAAKKVVGQFDALNEALDQHGNHVALIVIDLNFDNSAEATKGELLVYEILARSTPSVLNDITANFQNRIEALLFPILRILNETKTVVAENDPILQKLISVQEDMANVKHEGEKLANEFEQQIKNESWEVAATVWHDLNHFLTTIIGLRNAVRLIEEDWNRQRKGQNLNRPLTLPIIETQIDPAYRHEVKMRVPFNLFLFGWPISTCRKIARIINPSSQFQLPITELELILKYGMLLNYCGPLTCSLFDDEIIHPNDLFRIKTGFENLIAAQGLFCKQIQFLSNEIITPVAGNGKLEIEAFTTKNFEPDLRELLAKMRRFFDSSTQKLENATDQLDARTASLKTVIEPITKLYSEPDFTEIRRNARGKGVPEQFLDWALSQFQSSSPPKLPSKGRAYIECGPDSHFGKQLIAANHGVARSTLARHLSTIRRELTRKGYLESNTNKPLRKLAKGYDPSDERHMDVNQPDPSELAADQDALDQSFN